MLNALELACKSDCLVFMVGIAEKPALTVSLTPVLHLPRDCWQGEAKRRAGPQTVKGKSRRAWPNNDGSPDGHDEASCCASGQRQAPGSPSILTNASQPTAKYMRGTGRRPRRGSLRMGIGCAPAGSNPRFLAHRIGHRGPACQCRKLCSDRGWGRCTGIRLVGCRAYGAGFTHCPSRVYAMSCIPSHLPRRGIP
jgi:hypothetical protein